MAGGGLHSTLPAQAPSGTVEGFGGRVIEIHTQSRVQPATELTVARAMAEAGTTELEGEFVPYSAGRKANAASATR